MNKLIILEKPYVSSLLKQTIISNQIPVLKNDILNTISLNGEFNSFESDELTQNININDDLLVYSNSENSIEWVNKNLKNTPLPNIIAKLKNKYRFREIIQPLFPNFYFQKIRIEDIDNPISFPKFPIIIKPSVGFFSLGIYVISNNDEWIKVKEEIKSEVGKIKGLFPLDVVNLSEFIIEEVIDGEEYAIDVYYKKNGKPVILNIYKHLFSSDKDVSDRSYHTSKEIINNNLERFTNVLAQIGRIANLKNFPMHIEMRTNSKNEIIPIEANPLRFAGWCMSDMAYYAYGINPYNYYFEQKEPDWNQILANKNDKIYNVTIAEISKDIILKNIETIDYESFLKNFSKPLELRKTNFKEYPVFAFMFSESNSQNKHEIEKMLYADMREFIKLK